MTGSTTQRLLRHIHGTAALRAWIGISLASVAVCVLTTPAQAITGYGLRGKFFTTVGTQAKGVAVDQGSNEVYVASPFSFVSGRFNGNGAVEQFSASGTLSKAFEINPPEPVPGFSGVAVDPVNHDVYAYDSKNQLIDAYDSTGTPADVFAGGTASSLPVTGGQGFEVQIASDSSGDIYYPSHTLGEVQEYEPDGTSAPLTITGLQNPTDVAVTTTRIYVIDANPSTGNSQLQQFDSSGNPVGSGLLGAGVLSDPKAVTADASGNVFVIDDTPEGPVVDEFGPAETLIRIFGVGIIANPLAIAVNVSSGNVYVVEGAGFFSTCPVLIFEASTVTTPTAVTEPAAGVNQAGATAVGTVNPGGGDTKVYFQYGTTTAYGQSTSVEDAGSGVKSSTVEASLSLLEPSRTYHYRIVATNTEGDRAYGADREFTTLAAPPLVRSEQASGVTQTDAVLEAQVDPDNQATTSFFRYGTSPTLAGASTVPAPPGPEIGAGFEESPVAQDVGGGLTPNTTYYFQAVATNATGVAEGQIESFTTLPLAPVAEVDAASGITKMTATLNGMVVTQAVPTSYSFQYVSDASFATSGFENATSVPQPEANAGAESQATQVTTVIGGLSPDTMYHVRLVATNAGGVTDSNQRTFTTVVAAPAVVTGLPVAIAPTAVTVNAGVNPENGQTTFGFQYVDQEGFVSNGYQDAVSVPAPEGSAGSTDETQLVTTTLSDLSPGRIYHYRVVATNAGGTTIGADETFAINVDASSQEGSTSSPFGIGVSTPLPALIYPDLSRLHASPSANTSRSGRREKTALTHVQRLDKALRACKRVRSTSRRKSCERANRKALARIRS
jgi:hypothetical protein